MAEGLRFGRINRTACHICVDMQELFRGKSPWAMPWFDKVLPTIGALIEHDPSMTVFTRFLPAKNADEAGGTWARYYQRWDSLTLDRVELSKVDIVPELKRFVPPAVVVDKVVYSPWWANNLLALLRDRRTDTLLISGGETDVCVLTTVLGAVDLGFRVIVVSDAVCSSSDAAHDAMQLFYNQRLSQQVETASTEEVLENWIA
ncbi:cysteine hydrolase family protein [Phyllobacterium lublinensis]|uniref:cysteine hydrolase family protein n=1 Tax=Phyllobacterium lublinensis TaxID=2875708 RepID=UPI001CCE8BFD|nr:cysteine hydrolase [Phyllobacterium sp. 2063]MBZ9653577.1 cysteine hydrolase [Phyllobacterium sp. 2063]